MINKTFVFSPNDVTVGATINTSHLNWQTVPLSEPIETSRAILVAARSQQQRIWSNIRFLGFPIEFSKFKNYIIIRT